MAKNNKSRIIISMHSNEKHTPAVRLNEVLTGYWRAQCGNAAMPLEASIQPGDLENIWPSCFLLNVEDRQFRYDYLGEELIEAYGMSASNLEIAETLIYPDSPPLLNAITQAIAIRQPVEDEGEFNNHAGAVIRYRAVVLPLSRKKDDTVAFVLGGMRWRIYSRYEKNAH